MDDFILKVSSSSTPQSVAGAIANAIYEKKPVVARCIGAGAVNQAVKAIAIARGFVATKGYDLTVAPGFQTLETEQGSVSAMTLRMIVN